jgi:hypothetical protein
MKQYRSARPKKSTAAAAPAAAEATPAAASAAAATAAAGPIVFSGLTQEQATAIAEFHRENGATAEIVATGTTYSVLVTYPDTPVDNNPSSGFAQQAVAAANAEWDFFGNQTYDLNGHATLVGHKEGENGWYQQVEKYWLEGTNTHGVDGRDHGMYWSATFISYIMKKAGAGDRFRYSTMHSVYIYQGIRDRLQGRTAAGYWTWRLSEIKPKVGDLVAWTRESGIDYDHQNGGSYGGHADLIVQVLSDRVLATGGNVGNSVTRRALALDSSGYLKPRSSDGETIIAIMQNRIG